MSITDNRQDAQDVIDAVMADAENPYFNPDDPRHERAVEEMRKLHEIVHAEDGLSRPRAEPEQPMFADRASAEAAIEAVLRDPAHPYFDPDAPQHRGAVEDMKRLFRIAYGDIGEE
tara:strand:- start:69 stop:416 length:348 start_codon:yes stop_codon:yes gene_type:complete